MVRSRASAAFNSEFKDFSAPLDTSILAPADITGAKANGSATGARVTDPALLEPDEVQVATVSTSRQGTEGAGTTAARDHVLEVNVPDPSGENLHAGALHVASQSTITASPPAAEQMSVAESLDVNVMEGVVTADVVRAVAEVRADPLGATYNSLSSSFKNLRVDSDGVGPAPPRHSSRPWSRPKGGIPGDRPSLPEQPVRASAKLATGRTTT